MKKNLLLMVLPLLLALFIVPACADTLQEEAKALKAAETFDGQLSVLNRIAEEFRRSRTARNADSPGF